MFYKIGSRLKCNSKGLTLPELLIATVILLPIFVGVMLTFIYCMQYSEMASNQTTAILACKNRMTQIENAAYTQVFNTFNNTTFTVNGFNGMGITYIDNTNPDLLQIITAFCWRERNGRIVGEDRDLDGNLDAGEDVNGNGRLDSRVQLVTLRYNL